MRRSDKTENVVVFSIKKGIHFEYEIQQKNS